MNIIAIITPDLSTFKTWCKERKIKQFNQFIYTDGEDQYKPIIHPTDVISYRFSDYEVIRSFPYPYNLIASVKIRLK